jgi:hypothetical protein
MRERRFSDKNRHGGYTLFCDACSEPICPVGKPDEAPILCQRCRRLRRLVDLDDCQGLTLPPASLE